MKEHECGNADFTSRNGPWELLYYEAFLEKEHARLEEKFLKTGKGRERLKFLFPDQELLVGCESG